MSESIFYGPGYGIHDLHPVAVLIINIADDSYPVSAAFGDLPGLVEVCDCTLIIPAFILELRCVFSLECSNPPFHNLWCT